MKISGTRSWHVADTRMVASVIFVHVGLTGDVSMVGFSLSSDYATCLSP